MKNKFKISREVLLQLADNNSFSEELIKKEFPQLFESEKFEYKRWIKDNSTPNWICYYDYDKTYGIDADGEWFELIEKSNPNNDCGNIYATPQEVETAFKGLFNKLGFVDGSNIKAVYGRDIVRLDFRFKTEFDFEKNEFWCGGCLLFKDGQFAEIIETPTDIITIIEKYGKEKVQEYLNNAQ